MADTVNHTIRKVTLGGVVTTLAGSAGQFGSADGTASAARFRTPFGVALDSAGNVYVADIDNHRISKGTPLPTFTGLEVSAGAWQANLSGLSAGTRVIFQSSSNLRDWLPIQTNVAAGTSLPVSRLIDPSLRAEFLRAVME